MRFSSCFVRSILFDSQLVLVFVATGIVPFRIEGRSDSFCDFRSSGKFRVASLSRPCFL